MQIHPVLPAARQRAFPLKTFPFARVADHPKWRSALGLLCLSGVMALSGCASLWSNSSSVNNWQSQPKLAHTEGSLVIYRTPQGNYGPLDIYFNDNYAFTLPKNSYAQSIVCSGAARISVATADNRKQGSAKPQISNAKIISSTSLSVPVGKVRVFELFEHASGDVAYRLKAAENVAASEKLTPSTNNIVRTENCSQDSTLAKAPGAIKTSPVSSGTDPIATSVAPTISSRLESAVTAKSENKELTATTANTSETTTEKRQITLNLVVDMLFGFGKSSEQDIVAIKGKGPRLVNSFTDMLHKQYANVDTIHIIGYTDPIGDPKTNKALSLERAQSVRQALVRAGFGYADITTEAKGAGQLAIQNCPKKPSAARESCNLSNRRVEIQISGTPR